VQQLSDVKEKCEKLERDLMKSKGENEKLKGEKRASKGYSQINHTRLVMNEEKKFLSPKMEEENKENHRMVTQD